MFQTTNQMRHHETMSHPACPTQQLLHVCRIVTLFATKADLPGGTKQLIAALEDFITSVSTFNFQLLCKGIALPHRPLALCYKVSCHQSDIRT